MTERFEVVHLDRTGQIRSSCRTLAEAIARLPEDGEIVVHDDLIEESLVVDRPVRIRSAGERPTIWRSRKGTTIEVTQGSLRLSGLTIEAPADPSVAGHAIHVVSSGQLIMEQCELRSGSLAAIAAGGSRSAITLTRCRFVGCRKAGIFLYRYARATLEDVHILGAGLAGLEVTTKARATVAGCSFQGCRQDGAVVKDPGSILTVTTSQLARNSHSGLAAFGGAFLEATFCQFDSNGQVGVLAADRSEARLLGNRFVRQWRGGSLAMGRSRITRSRNHYVWY